MQTAVYGRFPPKVQTQRTAQEVTLASLRPFAAKRLNTGYERNIKNVIKPAWPVPSRNPEN
ncbi:hypothetical protein GCM10009077_10800 [Roseibium denhamense]